MNTAEFLDISSAVVPDRAALLCGDTQLTFAQMAAAVTRLANALQALGLSKGDHVAVLSINSAEYVVVYYACAKLGLVLVPLNYRAKHDELAYMINTAEVKTIFVSDRYADLLDAIRPQTPSIRQGVTLESKRPGFLHYPGLVAAGSDDFVFTEIEDKDPTILLFTSGTTAMPKGVVTTYQDFTVYVTNTMSPADPDGPHNKTLLSVPLFHIAGATAMLSAIWGGRTLVVLPQFTPEGWIAAVDTHGVTHSMVVPTMLKRIMEVPAFQDFRGDSLQLITYGAAPMPYEVVRRAIDVFRCGLMNAYGQTESTSTITFLGPDDHRMDGTPEENEKKLRRLRSVGRPMDDVAIAIQDPAGNILSPGEEGEICVMSTRVMAGYFKQDDATHETIREGWLHTADVGYLDDDTYLFITGRTKDLIIRGGENISPGEIEQVLEDHPAIEEAAVIGVPDVDWGEAVKAVVVAVPGMQFTLPDLVDYCKGRLASYKAPAYLALVEELPRNPMGKVLKTDLRKFHGGPDNL